MAATVDVERRRGLRSQVRRLENLVAHRERILRCRPRGTVVYLDARRELLRDARERLERARRRLVTTEDIDV